MKIHLKKKSAFTLIEVILYIMIVSVISVTMIATLFEVIKTRVAAEREREILENGRYAVSAMVKAIRAGHEVATGTGSETHPAAMRVYLDESNTTFFDLDTNVKAVLLDGNVHIIRYLQYNLNAGTPIQITSNSVNVQLFTLQQLTSATEPTSIQIRMILEYADGAGETVLSQTSVSLRQ